MLRQTFFVDARLVVKAFQVAQRRELHQVLIPGSVLGQQQQMVAVIAIDFDPVRALLAVGNDVRFHADNRLDRLQAARFAIGARVAASQVHTNRAEHVAVIGQRDGGHAHLLRRGDHVRNAAGAIKQTVVRVIVQMHEGGRFRHRIILLRSATIYVRIMSKFEARIKII